MCTTSGWGSTAAVPTIFGDINGDGIVNVTDYNDVRERIGTTLPPVSEPPVALAAASQSGPPVGQTATVPPSESSTSIAVAPASDSGSEVVQTAAALPSVSNTSIAVAPASQGGVTVVPIGTSNSSQPASASRARPRPRAEIRLSGRGSRPGTLAKGKMIKQHLIEKSHRDTTIRNLHDDSRQPH